MARKIPAALAVEGALDSVITNPCSKLLDIDLPVMLCCSTTSVCAFVPGHYLTNVPEYRERWLGTLVKEGVVQLVPGITKGVAALQAAWVCFFPSKEMRMSTVRKNLWATQLVITLLTVWSVRAVTHRGSQCLSLYRKTVW